MKKSQLKKIYFKKRTQKSFKNIKNKKITAIDYTNESEKVFLKAYEKRQLKKGSIIF